MFTESRPEVQDLTMNKDKSVCFKGLTYIYNKDLGSGDFGHTALYSHTSEDNKIEFLVVKVETPPPSGPGVTPGKGKKIIHGDFRTEAYNWTCLGEEAGFGFTDELKPAEKPHILAIPYFEGPNLAVFFNSLLIKGLVSMQTLNDIEAALNKAAHEFFQYSSLVHCDLKPDNIIVIGDGSPDQQLKFRFIDLGSAKIAGQMAETNHINAAFGVADKLAREPADLKHDLLSIQKIIKHLREQYEYYVENGTISPDIAEATTAPAGSLASTKQSTPKRKNDTRSSNFRQACDYSPDSDRERLHEAAGSMRGGGLPGLPGLNLFSLDGEKQHEAAGSMRGGGLLGLNLFSPDGEKQHEAAGSMWGGGLNLLPLFKEIPSLPGLESKPAGSLQEKVLDEADKENTQSLNF